MKLVFILALLVTGACLAVASKKIRFVTKSVLSWDPKSDRNFLQPK